MGAELGRRITASDILELFEKACPFYMSIGMTYNEFWEGDVALPKFYLVAYKKREERRIEQVDHAAWLNGLYTKRAYEVVLSNAFAKKGTPPQQYYEQPMSQLQKQKKKTEEEIEREGEFQSMQAVVALTNFVNSFKKK